MPAQPGSTPADETSDGWDPLVAAAPIFGKKWHLVVLHRLLKHDELGFNELARAVPGVSHKVLSSCLDDLQERNLVEREVVSEVPYRVRYSLTPFGETLEPVLTAMEGWGIDAVHPVSSRSQAVLEVPR